MELSKSADTSSVMYTASCFYHCHSSKAQRLQTKIGSHCSRFFANKEGRGLQSSMVPKLLVIAVLIILVLEWEIVECYHHSKPPGLNSHSEKWDQGVMGMVGAQPWSYSF